MTESLPGIQRRNSAAAETPTRLNQPDLAPADPEAGRPSVQSVVETAAAEAPILITEQEVLFSSAAAVSISSKKTAGQRIALLRPRRLFTRSMADERAAKHRHYPQHYVFLEQALMAREMERC
jgi:hypothetical protein